ncbi:MAG: M23 family metallopeptidase [Candidatus Aminicenantes bacterium]|nr:MAG: M23 family metallopeptidase [Candidatus Aminicenantes bacterium]
MRKIILFKIVFFIAGFSCLFSLQDTDGSGFADSDVTLDFRSLQQGDIVRVSVEGKGIIRKAEVLFLGETYIMGRGEESGHWLAFLGLDLGIKSGTYTIEVSLLFNDGHHRNIRREILVKNREFTTKKLWVEQDYVTPPQDALDRIQWESELLGQIYDIFTLQWYGEGPFIIPSDGEPNDNFGERRIFNNEPRSPHSGVDISSPHGTPVKASNSGRVVLAKNLYFAGNTIILDHGLGVFTSYLHISNILVERGEMVRKGDIIGEVGATGRVTGPHLHWGVKVSGSRIDPYSLLSLN